MSISLNVTNQNLYLQCSFDFYYHYSKFDILYVHACIIISHFYNYLTVLLKNTACITEYAIFDALK
jgi:hypothetical protein